MAKSKNTGQRATPIDVHVGKRIRIRRCLLGISQQRLGNSIHKTFQQVQKYEEGSNRVAAGVLYDVSKALDVPFDYFVYGYEESQIQKTAGLTDNEQEPFLHVLEDSRKKLNAALTVESLSTNGALICFIRKYTEAVLLNHHNVRKVNKFLDELIEKEKEKGGK